MSPVISESEIEELFCRSGGPGGQHVNKVSTAVTLRHIPTGVTATASDSRSQARNREVARIRLAAKLQARVVEKKLTRLAEAAKQRRRKAKRSRGTKAALVEGKRRRAQTKSFRKKLGRCEAGD